MRLPTLRQHVSGNYLVKYHGKTHYLGRDRTTAERLFQEHLKFLRGLEKIPQRQPLVERQPIQLSPAVVPAPPKPVGVSVAKAAERVQALIDSPIARRNFENRTRRFLDRFKACPIGSLTDQDLIDFREAMKTTPCQRFGRKTLSALTINHDLQETRRLLTQSFELGLIEKPYRMMLLEPVPVGPSKRKAKPVWFVQEYIGQIATIHPVLAKTLLLAFYSTMRPEETARLLGGKGQEVQEGVIEISESKTVGKLKEARYVLLSPAAKKLYLELRGVWGAENISDAIRQACWKIQRKHWDKLKFSDRFRQLAQQTDFRASAHFLRHSSAQALADSGVLEEHIRAALGRKTNKVDRLYFRSFQPARKAMGVLPKLVSEPKYAKRPSWQHEHAKRLKKRRKSSAQRLSA